MKIPCAATHPSYPSDQGMWSDRPLSRSIRRTIGD